MRLFAVLRSRGSGWNDALPLEGQAEWDAHAAFMDELYRDGRCVFAGPLEGTHEALVVLRAADEAEARSLLEADPWTRRGLLTLARLHPWTLRLGSELVEIRTSTFRF
jgi:uncharacterized protein YciI